MDALAAIDLFEKAKKSAIRMGLSEYADDLAQEVVVEVLASKRRGKIRAEVVAAAKKIISAAHAPLTTKHEAPSSLGLLEYLPHTRGIRRAALVLRYQFGFEADEIGIALGISQAEASSMIENTRAEIAAGL